MFVYHVALCVRYRLSDACWRLYIRWHGFDGMFMVCYLLFACIACFGEAVLVVLAEVEVPREPALMI